MEHLTPDPSKELIQKAVTPQGKTIWPYQKDVQRFYGNPIGEHGQVNEDWKTASLVLVDLPYKMALAWDVNKQITQAWFHWRCAKEFLDCLEKVKLLYSPMDLVKNGLTLYGGTYTYRVMKGGSRLSMHAYGCAMDIDPEHNQFGSRRMRMPKDVVEIFENAGFTWGGRWRKPDAMHFQAARV